MTAAALIKTTISIEEWLAATTFVKQRNIIHKMFFLGTTTLLFKVAAKTLEKSVNYIQS